MFDRPLDSLNWDLPGHRPGQPASVLDTLPPLNRALSDRGSPCVSRQEVVMTAVIAGPSRFIGPTCINTTCGRWSGRRPTNRCTAPCGGFRHWKSSSTGDARSSTAVMPLCWRPPVAPQHLYDQLRQQTPAVSVANPLLIRWIGAAPVKTDSHDTLKLARLLAADLVPLVLVPPPAVRDLRALVAHRRRLIAQRTQTRNRLHALLQRHNLMPPRQGPVCPAPAWLVAGAVAGTGGTVADEPGLADPRCTHAANRAGRAAFYLAERA